MVADQVLRDSFGGRFDHVSRDRVGCVLGVCSGLELVGEMAGPAPAARVRQDAARARAPRGRGPGDLERDREPRRPSGTRARSPACSTTSSPAGSPTTSISAARTSRPTRRARARSPPWRWRRTCFAQGDADLVITGGADTTNDPFTFMCFSKTPALSLSSTCRPFSESSDGTMLGEGHRHARAQAPRRRRARRRSHLRGHPRLRQLVGRPRQEHLRAALGGAGQVAPPLLRGGGLRARRPSTSSRRTAPGPRPATRRSSTRCARSSTRAAARTALVEHLAQGVELRLVAGLGPGAVRLDQVEFRPVPGLLVAAAERLGAAPSQRGASTCSWLTPSDELPMPRMTP